MVDTSRGGRAILKLILTCCYLPLVFCSDCGIDFGSDSPYAFTEVREDTTVGTFLGNFSVTNFVSVNLSPEFESSFIEVLPNEESTQIYFVLKRPLYEYRTKVWSPSIEIDVNLNCTVNDSGNGGGGGGYARSNVLKSKSYTFMSLIEDCNLYAPEFNSSVTEFNMTYPWDSSFPLNKEGIKVSDIDYNKIHATVKVSCVSEDCKYFRIETNSTSDNFKGHSYEVFVYPLKEDSSSLPKMGVGTTFSLALSADDSNHTSDLLEVHFVTTKVAAGYEESDSSFPTTTVASISGGLLLLCALLGSAWGYTWWRGGDAKRSLEKLTETEIREFLEGTAGFGEGIGKRSVDVNMPVLAKPYNKAVDIPRDKLKIDETSILGTGFFGVVMKGIITHPNGETSIVAVKKVKRNVGVVYFKALLSELKIMSFLGKHSNIVGLVGACTHNIRKREVFIAVEFCANGNLHNYLLTHRSNFVNLVRDGKLCGIPEFSNSYTDLEEKDSNYTSMSTMDLIKWCYQIASGLDYLGSSKGIVHGDLATRNVLLDSNNIAKIADFGLSRRLVDVSNYYYSKQSQAPLPWKWMAPETLKDMKFSPMSDIWSFGVVLWEVFTIGQIPYAALSYSDSFVQDLEKGLRLGQPMYASNSIYEIMKDCWTGDPNHRPNAFDIKMILHTLLNTLLKQTEGEGYMTVIGNEHHLYIGDYAPVGDQLLSQVPQFGDNFLANEIPC